MKRPVKTEAVLTTKDLIRLQAENDLVSFIKLVHPRRVLGSVHEQICGWWTREEAKTHQLLLMPRDHGKSALVAYRVAWEITRNPAVRVLYISATANLATKQLKFIKDILASDIYAYYWPEMIHPEEGKRSKWTESEISVDHPIRKAEAIRDPTVFTGGLTTTLTGLHCDISVLDDVVIMENAYTEEGRDKVMTQFTLLTSIEGTESQQWVVGTRYHPKDLYNYMLDTKYELYDENLEVVDYVSMYEVFERQVENRGDGTGEFLWPKQQRSDGVWYGFDAEILAKKRASYRGNLVQFRAQYYNDPNDAEGSGISNFQHYDRSKLTRVDGKWHINGRRLNVFAAVDFAYTLVKKSDFSAIVVVGVDAKQNYYVLDIERFKTDRIAEYFRYILELHRKWDFRKIRAEVTAAQGIIVKDLKDNYIKTHGLALAVEEHKPNRHIGTKEERIRAALQAKYDNGQMWHYEGGNCQVLEDELRLTNPPHDDVKDALASVVEACVPPSSMAANRDKRAFFTGISRFGGIG